MMLCKAKTSFAGARGVGSGREPRCFRVWRAGAIALEKLVGVMLCDGIVLTMTRGMGHISSFAD